MLRDAKRCAYGNKAITKGWGEWGQSPAGHDEGHRSRQRGETPANDATGADVIPSSRLTEGASHQ